MKLALMRTATGKEDPELPSYLCSLPIAAAVHRPSVNSPSNYLPHPHIILYVAAGSLVIRAVDL
jgi:hypothetical protein